MLRVYHNDVEQAAIADLAIRLLPDVCQQHVYRCDHERSLQMVDDSTYVYISWIFFNDERVRLKCRVKYKNKHDPEWLTDIKLVPMCDDFEEWQADAIMRCEAGGDVWHRPKQQEMIF